MDNEVPTLKFDMFDEELNKEKLEIEKPVFNESPFTPEEMKVVDDFVNQIDLNKSNQILQYGVGAQKKISDFSESALNNVKTKDLGEIGEMLSGVVSEFL